MTKEIPLTQGKVALVDDEDYEWLNEYNWHFEGRYAASRDKDRNKLYMHKAVLKDIEKGNVVDHINRDKLDNRKSNLRYADYSSNSANSKLASNNTTGYRGVYKRGKYWRVALTYEGKQVSGGYYSTKEEAAEEYNRLAIKHFGEFAFLNDIDFDKGEMII